MHITATYEGYDAALEQKLAPHKVGDRFVAFAPAPENMIATAHPHSSLEHAAKAFHPIGTASHKHVRVLQWDVDEGASAGLAELLSRYPHLTVDGFPAVAPAPVVEEKKKGKKG